MLPLCCDWLTNMVVIPGWALFVLFSFLREYLVLSFKTNFLFEFKFGLVAFLCCDVEFCEFEFALGSFEV